jgi:hypothetical protein
MERLDNAVGLRRPLFAGIANIKNIKSVLVRALKPMQ